MFVFIACGTWLIGLGIYFMLLRPPLLPEDARYIGAGLNDIRAALPGLTRWLHRVFTVMGGFIAGSGVLTIAVAVNMPAAARRWTFIALGVTGLLTVGTMTATNFQLDSAFKVILLVPSLLWLGGLIYYAMSRDEG